MSQRSKLIMKLAQSQRSTEGRKIKCWEVVRNEIPGKEEVDNHQKKFDRSHLGTAENRNEIFDDFKENVTNNTECPKKDVNGPLINSSVSTYKDQSNFLQAENNNLSNTCIERNSVAQHLDDFPGSSENADPFANSDDSDKDPDYLLSSDITNSTHSVTEKVQQKPEEQQHTEPKKTRKRKRNTSGWKKNAAKIARNSGKGYVSTSISRKVMKAREMKRPCTETCKLKCSSKITTESRKLIFENYWALGDIQRQRDYLSSCMAPIKPKYQYHRNETKRRDNNAFHFTINGTPIRVCKLFFKSTLDITDRPIRTVIDKKSQVGGMVLTDLRGKHGKHRKLDHGIKDGIRRHINSIPRIESHYTRARSSCEYTEGGKSLRDLHRDYVKECTENNIPYGNYLMYHHIFTHEYNISFFRPKKDQCSICATYANANQNEQESLKDEFEKHLSEKNLSRTEKQSDKQKISDNYILACFDLQAVMPCPKGETSTFYYKSKLNVLNFTVYELRQNEKGDQCYCYVWDETQGQRGANEIGSCLFKYIEQKSKTNLDGAIEILLYSDNCVGQQKNRYILSMYIYALLTFQNIKSITHKFLIVGHTQNEGDNAHSLIERQVKRSLKSGPIFLPAEYVGLIKGAKKTGNPYLVTEMSFKDFFQSKATE
ncbi:hypothetical protein ILUMI_09452 [Ignelater luminosus]|uniref:DUF7869 domain-containing protein n=1 Tax=Ignelater luminosus TaxID=2038154 RepID=A0A8K0CZQ3_IGNLU|nr:hypothetical protein ILUMI_09452 [Ignelater luminosus]